MRLVRKMFVEINPRISELNRKFTTFLHVLLRRHESPQATFEKIEKVSGSSLWRKWKWYSNSQWIVINEKKQHWREM